MNNGKRQRKAISQSVPPPKLVAQTARGQNIWMGLHWSPARTLAIFLFLVAFAAYLNTVGNGYVLDDASAITENIVVQKGVRAIPEIMATPYHFGFGVSNDGLYRPLSLVMFATEYEFFGLNPLPGHLINLFVYGCCVVLFFFFLDWFFERRKTMVAFIASLLFALHPVHTEVVANIKSRDELLCFFFAFLALNVFALYQRSGKFFHLFAGSCCFLLSLLSKETAVTFLLVIPVVFLYYRNEHRARAVRITGSAIFVTIIALGVRIAVLRGIHAGGFNVDLVDNSLALKGLTFSSRFAGAIYTLGDYLKILVVPYPLISDYSYAAIPFVTFGNPFVLLSVFVYILFIILIVRSFIRGTEDPFVFAGLLYFSAISVVSNIFFLIGADMAERFLFFGSAGFCIVAALLLVKVARVAADNALRGVGNYRLLAWLVPLCLVYLVITVSRNNDWRSNLSLYLTDVRKSPNSCKLNYLAGLEIVRTAGSGEAATTEANLRKGISFLQKAVAIDSGFGNGHSDLGSAFFYLNELDSAEAHELLALRLNPGSYVAATNLGSVYFNRKRFRESIDLYTRAIGLNSQYAVAYSNLGQCFIALARYDSAIYFLNKGIMVDPGNNVILRKLADAYNYMGNSDSVNKYMEMANKQAAAVNL